MMHAQVLRPMRRRFSSLVPPLIDVRCFRGDGTSDADKDRIAAAASSASKSHGLLALPAYGGIETKLVSAAFDSVHRLFELPLEKKMELAYRDVRENVGYIKEGNTVGRTERSMVHFIEPSTSVVLLIVSHQLPVQFLPNYPSSVMCLDPGGRRNEIAAVPCFR